MGKLTFLLFVIVTTKTSAIDLACRYDVQTDWHVIDNEYYCDLNNSLDIPNSETPITSVTGEHTNRKSNSDVVGFRANNKTLHYLPRGLEQYFVAKSIKFIVIWSTGLKEIHQTDVSPFTFMKYVSVWDNDLQVIERDLFKFNPRIEYLGLGKNKIKFIDGDVFQHLSNLDYLFLDGNVCIPDSADGNKARKANRFNLMNEIKRKCQP